jgi:carboxypeptidase C (cathepsin A)
MPDVTESTAESSNAAKKEAEAARPTSPPEVPPVVRQHTLALERRTLHYTTTTGMMPLANAAGETEAHIYFMAYTLDGQDAAERPLIFVFNGGPGSASVWLHLGALGPYRVQMQDEGWMPAPPYWLVANPHTWLDMADLVFVDPVGTGYSRALKPEDNKKYWTLDADLQSTGEFIRLYLTRWGRWGSPLYITGESYGTTRAAGLSGHLLDKGIALKGLMLISTVLNFQTLEFDRGNDLGYMLFVPTLAATAWYHKRLVDDLLARRVHEVMAEVEAWAEGDYAAALAKGDRLGEAERAAVAAQLARYTGLDAAYIRESNLRIEPTRFRKELLRAERWHVGRLDSRFKGRDALPVTEFPEFDPSLTAILPPYTAMINQYVRATLGYETDVEYRALSMEVNQGWEWGRGKYPDTSEGLRTAFTRNPFMRVFLALGLYDLATPPFAAHYTLGHMDLSPDVRRQIVIADYEAGHMMYLDVGALAKLKEDVRAVLGEDNVAQGKNGV